MYQSKVGTDKAGYKDPRVRIGSTRSEVRGHTNKNTSNK